MLALSLKADLDGVTNLTFVDSPSSPYFFTFKVACTKCQETRDNAIGFNAHEMFPLSRSRGEANFTMKCKFCGSEGNISVTSDLSKALYTAEESGSTKKLVQFDCRGLDLLEFSPLGKFKTESLHNGSPFIFEFEEGEWYDYDESAGSEVNIVNTQWTIQKVK